jgi:hypothetical protein
MPVFATLAILLAGLGQSTVPAAGSSFELRESALLDLHMFVRQQAAADVGAADALSGLAEAVEAAKALETALGSSVSWGLVEPIIAQSQDAAALAAAFSGLPESQQRRDGSTLRIREPAVAYARALAAVESGFLERTWPERREAIERGRQRLAQTFNGRDKQCVAHLLESLGMQDPAVTVPVYLVADVPAPGAFTHRGRGGAVCIVGVAETDDSLLAELILHELIHALDLAAPGGASVVADLRDGLQARGTGPSDPAYRDIPHTLMFVQAGETVRRLLDPEHEHYGDARGYYAKVPDAVRAVREPWEQHLAAEISRLEAVERIVAGGSVE